MKDKKEAFTVMFPKETEELSNQKAIINFLTNQCYTETRRMGDYNANQQRNVFREISTNMSGIMEQTMKLWNEYTG